MTPRTLYRAASVVFVLFFLGHTGGGMIAQQSMGAQSDAVFASMKAVHFDLNGANCTWYGFWFGFGLTVSLFLLISAIMAWKLGSVAPKDWHVVSAFAWALFAAHVCNTYLAWRYFFVGPGVMGTAATLMIGAAAWMNRSEADQP